MEQIEKLTQNKTQILSLIGEIVQKGELYISEDRTHSVSITIAKGELILVYTDTTEEDPMDREATFSNEFALNMLADISVERGLNTTFDIKNLGEIETQTLGKIQQIVDKLLPEAKMRSRDDGEER